MILVAHEPRLSLGEVILVAAVSAGHRSEAFEACRYAVERLRAMKSVAKREVWQECR
jgi:molybdopterin synthase catalytic subunit